MNITGIDYQNLVADQFIPFSNNNATDFQTNPIPDFSQMLENEAAKSASSDTDQNQETAPVLSGGKAVIDKTSKLYETCQELETFLLKNLISSMRSTIQKSNLIDTGYAGGVYEDMLYDEYAKDFSKNAGFGFAEMAYMELTGQRGKTIAVNSKW
ncbi:MAG: rod-binding protein [Treponema sp.]|nr:rod-binding protein [Treponema sp.]